MMSESQYKDIKNVGKKICKKIAKCLVHRLAQGCCQQSPNKDKAKLQKMLYIHIVFIANRTCEKKNTHTHMFAIMSTFQVCYKALAHTQYSHSCMSICMQEYSSAVLLHIIKVSNTFGCSACLWHSPTVFTYSPSHELPGNWRMEWDYTFSANHPT